MRIALKFGYYGRYFNGYARQPNITTIEGEILKTLKDLGYINGFKEPFFQSASRTDKGVSALCNVVAFNTEKSISNILNLLNEKTNEIFFYASKEVKSDFNPRCAEQRWYRYYLKNEDFDMDILIEAASCFTGEHNFTNFARIETGKNPNRKIKNIIININNDFISIDFFAKSFLWNQIRRIISTIYLLHKRKISINDIKKALENPKIKFDFGLASANLLILKNIFYNFEFNYDVSKLKEIEEIEKEVISRCLSF